MKRMVIDGKTKKVFERPDGHLEFHFKDDATGYVDSATGRAVFDSGYDSVVGQIPGKGRVSCQFSKYFFELLKKNGVPTHYVETIAENVMVVESASLLGKKAKTDLTGAEDLYNLEWVFRNNAFGSFWRRHPFQTPCEKLHKLVEVYAKGLPGQPDILMVDESLVELGIMSQKEIAQTKRLLREIAEVMEEECKKRGLHLVDGKLEFGRNKNNEIYLIDDISPDVIRVCRGAKLDKKGNCTIFKDCIRTKLDKDGTKKITAKNIISPDELASAFSMK